MGLLKEFSNRIKQFRKREQLDQDLREEMSAHIVERAAELERTGIPAAETLKQALREFGSVTRSQEDSRAAWSLQWAESALSDLRYAVRRCVQTPAFTAIVILILSLGIGANTTIFTVVDSVMLKTLHVRNPQELVLVHWSSHNHPDFNNYSGWGGCPKIEGTDSGCSFSYPAFQQIHAQNSPEWEFSAFTGPARVGTQANGVPGRASAEFVSADFFSILGVNPQLGRAFTPEDDKPGAAPVTILSYSYWQEYFGANPVVVGKQIVLNAGAKPPKNPISTRAPAPDPQIQKSELLPVVSDRNQGISFTIVGVAPPGFFGLMPGSTPAMWVPLSTEQVLRPDWGATFDEKSWWINIAGRVKSGVNREQTRAALQNAFIQNQNLATVSPFRKSGDAGIELTSFAGGLESLRGPLGPTLFVFMALVGIVLVITCANIANLQLARASSKKREMTLRLALGASRGRLVRLALTETMLLAALGGIGGALLSFWGTKFVIAVISDGWWGRLSIDASPDFRILGFAIAVCTLTGILCGLAPALLCTRVDLSQALNAGGTGATSGETHSHSGRFRLADTLVIAQVGLAVLLLIGAGLFARTLKNLENINPGFDSRNLLLFSLEPEMSGYHDDKAGGLAEELQSRLSSLPGVLSVTYSTDALIGGALQAGEVYLEGDSRSEARHVNILHVGPGFFETMKIPLMAGRTLTIQDSGGGHRVAVINENMARLFFPDQDPLGRRYRWDSPGAAPVEIVGVVSDAKYNNLRDEIIPTVYVLSGGAQPTFELRTSIAPSALIPTVRGVVRNVDRNLPILDMRTQTEQIGKSLFMERLVAQLSSLFGLLALGLACIGLYGLIAYQVVRRTRELGVRVALGASPGNILRLALAKVIWLVAIGLAIGIVSAAMLTRFVTRQLYGVHPLDPYTFVSVVALMIGAALLASYFPARRASRVDPMVALRHE